MVRLLDASVLVSALSVEAATTRALGLMAQESQLAVNPLGLAEAHISLIRKCKRNEMTIADVHQARAQVDRVVSRGLLIVMPEPVGVWLEAVAIAERVAVHLRTADAIHVAWAKLSGAGLLTFDHDLAAAARAEGIDALT